MFALILAVTSLIVEKILPSSAMVSPTWIDGRPDMALFKFCRNILLGKEILHHFPNLRDQIRRTDE